MVEEKEGYVWHEYHNVLISYAYDYDYRVGSIKRKPPSEIPMRLERFQFVKGKLPDVFDEVQLNSHASHWEAVQKLFDAYKDEIEKLHAEECKGCTWNGKEMIFPGIIRRSITRILEWLGGNARRTK